MKNEFLVSICCPEVILIDGGVDLALTGKDMKGVFHLVLGHVLLDTSEDRILVYARLVRALLDEGVHQVVVLVAETLVREGGDVARLNTYINWASLKDVDVLQ